MCIEQEVFVWIIKEIVDETSKYIIFNLRDHIYKENHILYPTALDAIQGKDLWDDMKDRCDKIGYCSFTPERRDNGAYKRS